MKEKVSRAGTYKGESTNVVVPVEEKVRVSVATAHSVLRKRSTRLGGGSVMETVRRAGGSATKDAPNARPAVVTTSTEADSLRARVAKASRLWNPPAVGLLKEGGMLEKR